MGLTQENILGRYLLLFSVALFLLLTIPSLFSDGMFLDGLMYASIAKNLSLEHGGVWSLHYTNTFASEFNGHPPLAFLLQSLVFKLFGDHLWVERWYSLGTYFAISFFLYRIWKFIGKSKGTFWLPMLFLALVPLMTWSTANNMLENTMSVFTCAAVYFYLLSTRGLKYWFLLLSALMVVFAFLSKGFTGLYVWVFPFVFWLIGNQRNVKRGLLDALFLVALSVLLILILFYLNEDAYKAMDRYYQIQVVGSLESVTTVRSRFYIVTKLLTELLIPLGIMLLLYLWAKRTGNRISLRSDEKVAVVFFIVGFCGVLPIVVSLKQSGFYIVTTFPFFVIALSLLVINGAELFQRSVLLTRLKLVKVIVLVLAVGCVVMFFVSISRIGRDKSKIIMLTTFDDDIEDDTTIFIPRNMWSDWNIHAYFSRLKNVSLSTNTPDQGALYLSKDVEGGEFELTSQSEGYFLYIVK
ncbi:MAG: 4-amino-4-deoxy-L-arabinose transferase-like glycosyltransferase [Glaciecola sp.]|jgi:4-amino-4-deoxy-L-arabinose transferase-like glycosyltransferase